MEIEGRDKNDIEEILIKFGYKWEDTVSCTADDIYIKYGKIPPSNLRESKFKEEKPQN